MKLPSGIIRDPDTYAWYCDPCVRESGNPIRGKFNTEEDVFLHVLGVHMPKTWIGSMVAEVNNVLYFTSFPAYKKWFDEHFPGD